MLRVNLNVISATLNETLYLNVFTVQIRDVIVTYTDLSINKQLLTQTIILYIF